MNLSAALDKLITLQEKLAITTPIRQKVSKAYRTVPAKSAGLTSFPCVLNSWSLLSVERGSALRIIVVQVNSQFFFKEVDTYRAGDIAISFMSAYLDAIDSDLTLGGTVAQAEIRGLVPTFGTLEFGGVDYPGLNMMTELEFKEAYAFG